MIFLKLNQYFYTAMDYAAIGIAWILLVFGVGCFFHYIVFDFMVKHIMVWLKAWKLLLRFAQYWKQFWNLYKQRKL